MSPGPAARRPFLGVGLDELSGARAPAALAGLRAVGPVVWVPAVEGWLVTGHATAVGVMKDARTFTVDDPRFSTARVVGASMLSLDGAEHRRHRDPFVAPFRPRQVEEDFGATARSLAAQLVAAVRPAGRADLRTCLAGPLSVAVVAHALGLPTADAREVLDWYDAIVAAVSAHSAGEEPPARASTAVAELGAHIGATQGEHSVLTTARSVLTDREVVANAAVMMFGGIETTEGMITNAVLHLLEAPGWLDRLRQDRSLLAGVVEESLRLEPAAAVVDRYETRDVDLAGATVRRGDLVRVSITGANRDPAVYEHPDRFDPARPGLGLQLSFARGPHVCLAMGLARLEATVAVEAVLDLPGLRLAEPATPTGLVFRKPASLVVAWDPPPGG
ncbi:cytochrome P450 [uncultured Nocardioides sp.]|uniref:cytochrome P450 n=1 Tax=uncultured Nocardioides sp. TaxID=198441 RepID=UPI00262FD393|nr:cytochrome P450 [uncultured Nocardioides sp.]